MTPHPDETPSEIAARYGATIAPNVGIKLCPPCTFSADAWEERGNWREQQKRLSAQGEDFRRRLMDLADGTLTRAEVARKLFARPGSLNGHISELRRQGLEPRFKPVRGSRKK